MLLEHLRDRIQGRAAKGQKRAPGWRRFRREVLERFPDCAVCGKTRGLEVHHIIPFWAAPDLELDPENVLTLCRPHHQLFGHLNNFQRINEAVRADAAAWRIRILGGDR